MDIPLIRYKPDQIAQACDIKVEDVTKPQFGVIYHLYRSFIEGFYGSEDFSSSSLDAQLHLSSLEAYEESIPEALFLKKLCFIMMKIGITDFSPSDILEPDSGRTRQNLSSLIHLNEFRAERYVAFNELYTKYQQIDDSLHKLEMEVQNKTSELRALKSKREMEEPVVTQLTNECIQMDNELLKINTHQANVQAENKILKEEISKLQQQIMNAQNSINTLKQESNRLKSLIIPSPETFKKSVVDLKNVVENEKQACDDISAKTHKLEAKYESIVRLEKEMQKTIEKLDDIRVSIEKNKKARKQTKEAKKTLASTENEFKNSKAEEQHALRKAKSAEAKLRELESRGKIRLDSADLSVKEVQAEKLEVEKEKHAVLSKVDQNSLGTEQWGIKIESLKKEHEVEMNKMKENFDQLELQVQQYNHKLFSAMKTI